MKFTNEAKLGITVLLSAITFVVGVIYLRGLDLQRKEYTLTILYDNVNGLTEGSPITVAGLTVGKVEALKLVGNSIAVDVSIQNKVQFPHDSKAYIKSASIMGGKLIAIGPGTETRMLVNGDTLVGGYEADLTELTSTLAPISTNVLGILERVNTTFDEKTRRSIQNILADLNRSSAELNRVIRAEGERLDIAIQNFAAFSSNLSRFALSLDSITVNQSENLNASLQNIRSISSNMQLASDHLKSTTQSLNVVLGKIGKGEGTLGKLVHDDQLYNDADSAAANLNALLKDLRLNPKKYVNVSVF